MNINTVAYSIVLSALIGILWAFALQLPIKNGLIWGACIGLAGGFLLGYMQRKPSRNKSVDPSEESYVRKSLLGLLFIAGLASGLFALAVRLIFF